MKRILIAVSMMLMLSITSLTQVARAATTDVIIDGHVTNAGSPGTGFKVAANCFGHLWSNFVGWGTSDASGYYVIHTNTTLCPLGSGVEVRADQDGDGKFESSALSTATAHTTVDLILGQNPAVPELGWASSAVATLGVIILIVFIRRRYVYET